MIGILAAVVLGSLQIPPTAETVRLMGRDIALTAPADVPVELPADVAGWSGWKGIQLPGVGLMPPVCSVDHGLGDAMKGFKAPAADAPVWRVKIVLRRRYENEMHRLTFSRGEVDKILLATGLMKRAMETQTGLKVEVDVEDLGTGSINDDDFRLSMLARVNRGAFEADDRKYRGPYHLVIALGPLSLLALQNSPTEASYGIYSSGYGVPVSKVASDLLGLEAEAMGAWLVRAGLANPTNAPADLLAKVAGLSRDDQAKLVSFSSTRAPGLCPAGPVSFPVGKRSFTDDVELGLKQDAEKGPVLEVTSDPVAGGGVLGLFNFARTDAKKSLSFWVKRVSGPVATLRIDSSEYNLGATTDASERLWETDELLIPRPGWDIPSDGTWHHVSVPLASNAVPSGLAGGNGPESGGPSVVLLFRPSPSVGQRDKTVLQFADFQCTDGALGDAVAAGALNLPAVTRWNDLAKTDAATPDGLAAFKAALNDSDSRFRLYALKLLANKKVPELEAAIASAMDNLDGRISEAAATALKFQDTDAAWAFLRVAFDRGVTEREKAAAGAALASRKNVNFLGPLSSLMVARDWVTRVDAASAMGANGGPLLQTLLSAFVDQPEPEVRLTVVRLLDPMNDSSVKKLLFVSVNDASDAVRAEACTKLLVNPAYLKDGQRGVQDDSMWVRVQVLRYLREHPRKEDRVALQQAITSPDWEVRLAALQAFLTSPGDVDAAELGAAVLQDRTPAVEQILNELVTKKGLKRP